MFWPYTKFVLILVLGLFLIHFSESIPIKKNNKNSATLQNRIGTETRYPEKFTFPNEQWEGSVLPHVEASRSRQRNNHKGRTPLNHEQDEDELAKGTAGSFDDKLEKGFEDFLKWSEKEEHEQPIIFEEKMEDGRVKGMQTKGLPMGRLTPSKMAQTKAPPDPYTSYHCLTCGRHGCPPGKKQSPNGYCVPTVSVPKN